jgi:1-deoxy-D-xylulose-5-phosphate synthase
MYAPKDEIALRNILYTASLGLNHPIAIRYPRGRGNTINWKQPFEKIEIGKASQVKKGSKIAILSTGFIGHNVTLALEKTDNPHLFSHFDFGFVKPLDEKCLHTIFETHESIITVEEGVIIGGFGTAIAEFSVQNQYTIPIKMLGVPDVFIEQATVEQQKHMCGIDVASLHDLFSSFQE